MKTVTTFDKADYTILEAAKELAERIYLVADSESNMEGVAHRASIALSDLISEMESCPTMDSKDECPPCAGDCAECHCEGCIEDEPEAVTAEQLREKIAKAIGCEPKGVGVEVVTTPTGEELLKALAEIFGA